MDEQAQVVISFWTIGCILFKNLLLSLIALCNAGKSSLTAALFRLVEIESGRVLLDGRDLGRLGLADVRGRKHGMSIIPQNPFLAGTTIRECLDPFGNCEDQDILAALVDVRMASSISDSAVLDSRLEEGGSNFSVGERQLLNLARAILMKPRVLVLDEATGETGGSRFLSLGFACDCLNLLLKILASIDGETDAFVQRMLRAKFKNTTLLTVAHR